MTFTIEFKIQILIDHLLIYHSKFLIDFNLSFQVFIQKILSWLLNWIRLSQIKFYTKHIF